MTRQQVIQKEARLRKLIAVTRRHILRLQRSVHGLTDLNARRRADLHKLHPAATITKGGPDWSSNNGTVDVPALAGSGRYDLAIVKATEAGAYINPRFGTDWQALRKTSLHRGAYHFAHPDEDPVAQAHHFVSTVKAAGLTVTDILVVDVEINPGPGVDAWTDQFIAKVHELAPHNPVWLYTSQAWRTWQAREGRLCWVADLNGQRAVDSPLGLQGTVVLHQFTFTATVTGVNGGCDLNVIP